MNAKETIRYGRPVHVLDEIAAERARQDAKWGEQNHPDTFPRVPSATRNERDRYAAKADWWKEENTRRASVLSERGAPSDSNSAWDGILLEEVYEALAEANPAKLRAELIQVAAVAVAWIEAIDRRKA